MANSTGPIITAGALTLANQTILSKNENADVYETGARIGIATGILAMMFYGIEKVSPEFATGLAWVGLVTTLFVRYKGELTVMERALGLFD